MTKERAQEIIRAQSEFPYWGNYRRFMTPAEHDFVQEIFRNDPDGRVSIASIVHSISRPSVEA